MALTRDFRETVVARAKTDPEFREGLLTDAVEAFLTGDVALCKAVLRDYINATVGFEDLGAALQRSAKSLHRMLGPSGNPTATNLSQILAHLQTVEHIALEVHARRKAA